MSAPPAPAAQEREEKKDKGGGGTLAFFFLFTFVVVIVISGAGSDDAVCHVAIDAVAGLDPTTDLSQPTVAPEFNLTVRVDSGSWGDVCLEPGSAVAVSYHGVPLAGAALPTKLRAGSVLSGRERSVSLVATGSGVRVPGAVLDALAKDLRGAGTGTAEFEVTLTAPYEGKWEVASCRAKAGDAAAMQAPCVVSMVDSVPPAPQPAAG